MPLLTAILLAFASALLFWIFLGRVIDRMVRANRQEREGVDLMFRRLTDAIMVHEDTSPSVIEAVRAVSLSAVSNGRNKDILEAALIAETQNPSGEILDEFNRDQAAAVSQAVEGAVTALAARSRRRWAPHQRALAKDPELGARAAIRAARASAGR